MSGTWHEDALEGNEYPNCKTRIGTRASASNVEHSEYRFEYICPYCGNVMFFRKTVPYCSDSVTNLPDGAIYPDGAAIACTDGWECKTCGKRANLPDLDNFRERALPHEKEES